MHVVSLRDQVLFVPAEEMAPPLFFSVLGTRSHEDFSLSIFGPATFENHGRPNFKNA